MNLYFECERCFWLKVKKGIKRPSKPFPTLPNGMDDIIKEHFQKMRERDEVPPELKGNEVSAEPLQDEELLEKARNWRSEPKWDDPESQAVLCGEVDDLLRTEDGSIVVLDYKTRGYPPKQDKGAPEYYERQVNFYNLILRSNGYETKDFGLILYYHPDQVLDNGDVVFHNDLRKVEVDIEKAKRQVREAVETLEEEIPEHNQDCDYCEWNFVEHG